MKYILAIILLASCSCSVGRQNVIRSEVGYTVALGSDWKHIPNFGPGQVGDLTFYNEATGSTVIIATLIRPEPVVKAVELITQVLVEQYGQTVSAPEICIEVPGALQVNVANSVDNIRLVVYSSPENRKFIITTIAPKSSGSAALELVSKFLKDFRP